jgi:hypothetical protein
MTPLHTIAKSLKLIESLRNTNLPEHEQNKFIVEHIYRLLLAQNSAIFKIENFNVDNVIFNNVVNRSVFLGECLIEIENL